MKKLRKDHVIGGKVYPKGTEHKIQENTEKIASYEVIGNPLQDELDLADALVYTQTNGNLVRYSLSEDYYHYADDSITNSEIEEILNRLMRSMQKDFIFRDKFGNVLEVE